MATDLLILGNGILNIANSAAAFSASSTQNGYAVDNARETDIQAAWKPNDTATDESLIADCGSTGALGIAGATAYGALIYDSRTADQTTIRLEYGATDDGAFASPQLVNSWTINGANALAPSPVYFKFTIPGTAKRYYRLRQQVSDRNSLTRTAKIFHFDLYPDDDTHVIDINRLYANVSEDAYGITQLGRVNSMPTPGGYERTNSFALPGYRFEVNFGPANDALWQATRNLFHDIRGKKRAVYVAKEGLKNAAQQNFFLCRLSKADWDARRRLTNQYMTALEFVTESCL